MAAGKYDLIIEQGTKYKRTLRFRKKSDQTLINLEGETFKGQIRAYAGAPDVLAEFTCTLSNQSTNTGEVVVTLTPEQTSALPFRSNKNPAAGYNDLAYDIFRTKTDGTIVRVLAGLAQVAAKVTKDE